MGSDLADRLCAAAEEDAGVFGQPYGVWRQRNDRQGGAFSFGQQGDGGQLHTRFWWAAARSSDFFVWALFQDRLCGRMANAGRLLPIVSSSPTDAIGARGQQPLRSQRVLAGFFD